MDKIAVLIPCYNESKTVEKVVSDFRRVLPDATVYVYDNNSTDGTAELAAKAGAVVRHEYQQGKGNVMRRMFREIDAEAYILVDGDDTYPAEAAPEMVAAVTGRQADMVVGDRLSSTYYTQNKRPFHNFGNDLVRFFTNHLFGGKIKDIMTGYRAFSYQFVKTYPVLSRGFEVETEMTIHSLNNNLRLYEMPIQYRDRPEGSVSKLDTVGDGIKVMSTIFRMIREYKPITMFGRPRWSGPGRRFRYDFPALSSMIRGCCRRERGRPMTADRNQAGYTDASGAHGAGLVVMWVRRGRPDSSEPAATGKPS